MKKTSVSAAIILLISVMMLIVSCGEDPFFHHLAIKNDEGKTVTTIVVPDGDYTLPEKVDGLEDIEEWIYEDKEYAVGDVISVTKDSEITAITGTPVIVDNGDGTTQRVVVKKGETTLTLPKTPAERTGYVFDGWLVNNTLKEASAVVDYSEGMEIKAKWTAVYTITYNANGGTGTIAPDTLRADNESILLSDGKGFTNGNSRLTAWNTSADGSGTEYKTGAAYSDKANITLYAVWSDAVTVTFNSDGGSAVSSQEVTYGGKATKPTTDPTKDKYEFVKWVDSNGADFNFGATELTGDITLKAVWLRVYKIGEKGPAGGYIFYDCDADNNDENEGAGPDKLKSSSCGWRYLEASSQNLTAAGKWGPKRLLVTEPTTGSAIGTGYENTTRAEASMSPNGERNDGEAIHTCDTLTQGGYDNWFLPSSGELKALYSVREEIKNDNGNVVYDATYYWSSTEINADNAYVVNLATGVESSIGKDIGSTILPVRRFIVTL